MVHGTFTLKESEIETGTETDKMTTIPNDIGVSVLCEQLHTFLCKTVFSSLGL